jgi:RNA-directed DNA polymerase
VRGLHNYFKGMVHFNKSFGKIQWRINKLFRHVMSRTAKTYKLNNTDDAYLRTQLDDWGYQTWGISGFHYLHGFPILQLDWANWDKRLCAYHRQKVKRENPYDHGEKQSRLGITELELEHLVNTSQSMVFGTMRYRDFRVSKFSAVKGRSYITGEKVHVNEYYCHHIIPKTKGGTDDWKNLCVLSQAEFNLLHSEDYLSLLENSKTRKHKLRVKELISQVHDITIKI